MPHLPIHYPGAATDADLATASAEIQAAQVQAQFQALLASQASSAQAGSHVRGVTETVNGEGHESTARSRQARRGQRRQYERQQEIQEEMEQQMSIAQQRLLQHQRHLFQQQQMQVQQQLLQRQQADYRDMQRHQQAQLQQVVGAGDGEMVDGTSMEEGNVTQELEYVEEQQIEMEDSQMVGDITQGTLDNSRDDDEDLVNLKEIGNLASWTVSTAKPGCGVAALRDEDTELFWQSDGPQPHSINIHFAKRVFVKRIRIYLDYVSDESYTPTKISVLSGTGYHSLQEVTSMALDQPHGWVDVDLSGVHEDGILRTFLIQIGIHANHQNGKDTHVRGLQIFSPVKMLEGNLLALDAEETTASESVATRLSLPLSVTNKQPAILPINPSSNSIKSPLLPANALFPTQSPHTPVMTEVAPTGTTPIEALGRRKKKKKVTASTTNNNAGQTSRTGFVITGVDEEEIDNLLVGLGDLPDERTYEIPFTTSGFFSEFEIR